MISGGRVGRAATEAASVILALQGAVKIQNKTINDIAALTKGTASQSNLKELAARVKALEELVGAQQETTVKGKKTRTKSK